MSEQLASLASAFLQSYERFLESKRERRAQRALSASAAYLDENVTASYAGANGLVSKAYGSFQGKEAALGAMKDFRDEVKTGDFKVQEFVDTAFSVDFSNQEQPLTPSPNRLAVVAEQRSKARESKQKFRLDNVIYFSFNDQGLISDIAFSSDSYLMSQALVGDRAGKVPNPDIEDVITGRRDTGITNEETLQASLGFFGAFANIASVGDLPILVDYVQPNAAVKFGGDPRYLPFADKQIRVGSNAVVQTFTDQLEHSAPRVFDIQEIFVRGDRFIANTFEGRTAVSTGINYDIPVNILFTASRANGGRVDSIEGIFDSSITMTAFTGKYPFPVAA